MHCCKSQALQPLPNIYAGRNVRFVSPGNKEGMQCLAEAVGRKGA